MIRARVESTRGLEASELQRLFRLSYGSMLVQHRDSERHQLIGYQVDEHVRHRAVERLESEPSQAERVLTPLRGILGTRSVGKPALKLWRR